MGLTGTGKTVLAMSLYDALPCEIVSVDSAMIYQGMDIGSAKPEPELLTKYPHHLIDLVSSWQSYNAAQFVTDVNQCIEEIQSRSNIPLLVGGTMMYFKALQQGLNQLPESTPEVRQKLNDIREKEGLAVLYEQLKKCDPASALRINEKDPQRIQRALEVFELKGQPMSQLIEENSQGSSHEFLNIGLIPENRVKLHEILALRFDQMIEQGFEQEVRNLKEQGLTLEQPSMRCVGYKQMLSFLNQQCTFEEMRQQAIAATRQLAKRQHTWLRKWPELHAFDPWQKDLFKQVKSLL